MSTTKAINIDNLKRAAEEYDPTLRMLPFLVLEEELTKLGITLLEVDGTHKKVIFHRRGGLARPYVAGSENKVNNEEIGKAIERKLEPKDCYTALKDHILNYDTVRVISNSSEKPDLQKKSHPQELLILNAKVRTVGEDIIDALYHAERDEEDGSPMGMFDGYNTIINKEITANEISTAKGNLVATGALAKPANADDTSAYDKLVAFIRSANPFLRRHGWLYITNDALFHAMDALKNQLRYKDAMEYDIFVKHLAGQTKASGLKIVSEPCLGAGSRLMYTTPNNLDFGVGARSDHQFVSIRDPYEDPNIIQFWMQWKAGARIINIHQKEFQVNDQTNTSTEMSGDYS